VLAAVLAALVLLSQPLQPVDVALDPGHSRVDVGATGNGLREYQLTLDTVLDEMIERCRELKLRAVGHERQLRTDFTVLLTAKTVHSLYSPLRRQWIAL